MYIIYSISLSDNVLTVSEQPRPCPVKIFSPRDRVLSCIRLQVVWARTVPQNSAPESRVQQI